MRTLGLRAEPHAITFVVYDTDEPRILNVETIKIPRALSIPESLKYVRSTILDILREYSVERAGIRITEPTAQTWSIPRVQIEAIIQEAFASSSLADYYCGQISNISSRLGFPRTEFKKLVSGEHDYHAVEGWAELSNLEREATLVAMGAQNA